MAQSWPATPPEGTLEPIRARREKLEAAAHDLQRSLAAPSATSTWRNGVVEALATSQSVLESHVQQGSSDRGIPRSVVRADPRLAGPAERLHREHDSLMAAQRSVADLARDPSIEPDVVRDAAADLALLMLKHVQHAHDLLHDALSGELGGGD